MSEYVKKYNLLISCPSDVQEELKAIKEAIEEFNQTVGEANDAIIVVKHWSTSSYPESGGRPQKLLNEQIVLQCDAAVAVFWTKFGTPTDDYGSGTEEEIEELMKSDKQVFLYFSDQPTNPSKYDQEEMRKIQEFKERYREKGLYSTYTDISTFKTLFANHLRQYFLDLFKKEENHSNTGATSSHLSVKGISNKNIVNNPTIFQTNFNYSKFVDKMRQEINQKLQEAQEIYVTENDDETREIVNKDSNKKHTQSRMGETLNNLNNFKLNIGNFIKHIEVEFTDDEKNVVLQYARDNNISIDRDRFFNTGNLTKVKDNFAMSLSGPRISLEGTEDEEKKYNLIRELISKITKFNQWKTYFNKIDSNYYLELAVTNNGTAYDEDVDVKIFVEKGSFVFPKNLPFPGDDIIEDAKELFNKMYVTQKTATIDEYDSGYEPLNVDNLNIPPRLDYTDEELIKTRRDDFNSAVSNAFCYEFFQDSDYDIITFNIPYIKQNTNIAFPTLLVFNNVIEEISYEISSKYSPHLIKEKLELENENNLT